MIKYVTVFFGNLGPTSLLTSSEVIYCMRQNMLLLRFLLLSQKFCCSRKKWLEILTQNFTNLCNVSKWNLINLNDGEVTGFLVRPPSDFPAFKNVCTEDWYNVRTMSTRLLLMITDDVVGDISLQNTNLLCNFFVVTKPTEPRQVEVVDITSARHLIESEKLTQHLMRFQSDWRLVLKHGIDTSTVNAASDAVLILFVVVEYIDSCLQSALLVSSSAIADRPRDACFN